MSKINKISFNNVDMTECIYSEKEKGCWSWYGVGNPFSKSAARFEFALIKRAGLVEWLEDQFCDCLLCIDDYWYNKYEACELLNHAPDYIRYLLGAVDINYICVDLIHINNQFMTSVIIYPRSNNYAIERVVTIQLTEEELKQFNDKFSDILRIKEQEEKEQYKQEKAKRSKGQGNLNQLDIA